MLLGVFSRTYPPAGVERIFARIAQDGFQAVQFNFSSAGLSSLPEHVPATVIEEVEASAARLGLAMCAISGTYNMAHPDPARRRADRIGFANVVRAAGRMRVPLVTLCTGTRDATSLWAAHPDNGSAAAWSTMRAELDFALELAEQNGVTLGVEPEHANVIANARIARRLLDEVASPRLKIVLDAANLLPPGSPARQREVISEAVSLLGADLALVHTKDVSLEGEAVAAGRGIVDFPHFLGQIRSTGYRGALVSHNLREEDAASAAAFLRRVLEAGKGGFDAPDRA